MSFRRGSIGLVRTDFFTVMGRRILVMTIIDVGVFLIVFVAPRRLIGACLVNRKSILAQVGLRIVIR